MCEVTGSKGRNHVLIIPFFETSLGEDLPLNTLSFRESRKALKRSATEALLYLLCDNYGDSVDEGLGQGEDTPGIKPLLEQYSDVFRDSLLDRLPPVRDLEYEIDTGANAPVNTQAYALSNQQLKGQVPGTKQGPRTRRDPQSCIEKMSLYTPIPYTSIGTAKYDNRPFPPVIQRNYYISSPQTK
jgi:hypothetical protein